MSRRAQGLTVAAGLGVHALLAAGALGALPPGARTALAFLVLVMLPGYAPVAFGLRPPGGAWLAPGWALGFGVAWQGAMILATRALALPIHVLVWGSLATTALIWAPVLVAPSAWRRAMEGREPGEEPAATRWSPGALVALGFAVAVGAWHAGRLGALLGIITDSPDHIGTIRRMVEGGDAFPRDAFFRDAGAGGADPRKGLWHPQVALIVRLSSNDPIEVWRFLPACLLPLFVLNAAVFGYLLRGPPGAAMAGWALLLTYGGSMAEQYVREAVYSTKLGDQLALATTAAVLADLFHPSRRLRLAAVGLALGAIGAHVFYVVQFAMALPALGVGLLVAERGIGPRTRRLTATGLAIALAALPYLAWRWSQSYAPVNIIHTEPQGLLYFTDHLPIVSYGVLWDWLGNLWVLFPIAAPWLWRAGRGNPAVLYLLTTPLAVALLIFNPLAVRALEPRLGYLLMRMVWLVPLAPLLAWMLPGLASALRRGPGRLRAAAALAGILVLHAGPLVDTGRILAQPELQLAHEHDSGSALWADALTWVRDSLPKGSVVLTDPATAYSIPMVTGRYVTALSDQHSSPNDPRALERILDARDALDPYATWDRVREVVDRYRVDALALNDRFTTPPALDYWAPRPAWFAAARARFDREPQAFQPLFDRDGFVLYRVRRAALDSLSAPPGPRPFVVPWRPEVGSPGRRVDPDLPALCRFSIERDQAAPGDTVSGVADWRVLRPMVPGAYTVAVRFDRPLPGDMRPPAAVAKPVRKLIERMRGERYRFREDHLPVGGAYGVDQWRPDQVVRDSFSLTVPRDVAEGRYVVRIRMLRQPHYHNVHLRDYFYDDDLYSGLAVGAIDIRRREGATRVGRPTVPAREPPPVSVEPPRDRRQPRAGR